jgi:hypothetical protein
MYATSNRSIHSPYFLKNLRHPIFLRQSLYGYTRSLFISSSHSGLVWQFGDDNHVWGKPHRIGWFHSVHPFPSSMLHTGIANPVPLTPSHVCAAKPWWPATTRLLLNTTSSVLYQGTISSKTLKKQV